STGLTGALNGYLISAYNIEKSACNRLRTRQKAWRKVCEGRGRTAAQNGGLRFENRALAPLWGHPRTMLHAAAAAACGTIPASCEGGQPVQGPQAGGPSSALVVADRRRSARRHLPVGDGRANVPDGPQLSRPHRPRRARRRLRAVGDGAQG